MSNPTVYRGLMPRSEVCKLLGIKVGTLRAWVVSGRFPEPSLAPSKRRVWWRESVIEDWVKRNERRGNRGVA